MPERYIVIEVGCTECWFSSSAEVVLVTEGFREASDLARARAHEMGRQGDAFVITSSGTVVARDPDEGNWEETPPDG